MSSRRRNLLLVAIVIYVVGTIVARRRGYNIGTNTVVRCRSGHLFTTIWVPGASVKSIRLGPRRIQWCPVGRHWSLVTLVRKSDLSARELRKASGNKDVRVP